MPLTLNTKTYAGNGIQNGIASYTERSVGIASGFSDVTSSLKLEASKTRGVVKLTLPEVTTEASACACPGDILRTSDVITNIRIDPKAPAATRTDLYLRYKDLVASAAFRAMFEDLANMPGT